MSVKGQKEPCRLSRSGGRRSAALRFRTHRRTSGFRDVPGADSQPWGSLKRQGEGVTASTSGPPGNRNCRSVGLRNRGAVGRRGVLREGRSRHRRAGHGEDSLQTAMPNHLSVRHDNSRVRSLLPIPTRYRAPERGRKNSAGTNRPGPSPPEIRRASCCCRRTQPCRSSWPGRSRSMIPTRIVPALVTYSRSASLSSR
jgi:hypothetical protein